MTLALLTFLVTFISVFALGFQSRNNIGGHYVAAFGTSVVIGFMNLYLFKMLPATTDYLNMGAYILGGPCGICASMFVHSKLFKKKAV